MRLVAYSLFRSPAPIYWRTDTTQDRLSAYARFLPALLRAHHAIWPGYEFRLYHDEHARAHPYFAALSRMHDRGLLRLMPCGEAQALTSAMLWRMRPLFDENEHLVVTADLDSLPVLRLRMAVEEFAASGRALMLFQACESHTGVLGGGLAIEAAAFRRLTGCSSWDQLLALGDGGWESYAADEEFLRRVIWPRVAPSALIFSDHASPLLGDEAERRVVVTAAPPDDVLPEVIARGNDFAPYAGSAGYELGEAFAFYDGLPLPVFASIRECEGAIDLRRVMFP